METSLERFCGDKIYLQDYYIKIRRCLPQIETFTGQVWEVTNFKEPEDLYLQAELPAIDYMIYLRHHNFPSPLLDWTRAPFIATFFAFHDLADDVENVSIFAYIEWAAKGKSHGGRDPIITTTGEYIRTHTRHFLQQSDYSICTIKEGNGHYFASHEDVFKKNDEDQDLLWKIIMPSKERLKILAYLDTININAFSLFGTEESLMSTLALREFYLKDFRD